MDKKNIAIVTGASSGIGKEFVGLLLKEDGIDEMWAISRNDERLKEVKEFDKERVRIFSMRI